MRSQTLVLLAIVGGVAAVANAAITWSPRVAFGFVAVVVGSAFLAEVTAIRWGLLVHHTCPRVRGVPIAALAGWTAIVYASLRVALVVVGGESATPLVAGVVAVLIDGILDPIGVRAGWWSYPPAAVSAVRYAGVPWWNPLAWFVLAAASSAITLAIAV